MADRHNSTGPRTLTSVEEAISTIPFFSHDKIPIDMKKMQVFFLGKCDRTAEKPCLWREKKPEGTSSAMFLASGPLRNAANSSVVPTDFAAEPTTKMKSAKANS